VTSNFIYLATIWIIPVLIAIIFHEAAHGFVATFWVTTARGDLVESVLIR